MSFTSDAAALKALCIVIFDRGHSITVMSEGDRLCAVTRSLQSVSDAVCSVSDDCMLLVVDDLGARLGWFRVLQQDDPDCLIVDHSDNVLCNSIWSEWSYFGGI